MRGGLGRPGAGVCPVPRAAYFPEANPLVPLGQFAPGSRTPASKSVVIEVTPSAG